MAKSKLFGHLLILLASLSLSACRPQGLTVPTPTEELHDPVVVKMWKAQDLWLEHQRDGDFYIYVRRFDQARESFDAAIGEARKSFGNEDPRLARSLTGLGRCFLARRDYPLALQTFEEALKIKKAKYKNPSIDVADLLTEIAHVKLAQSDVAQARALINQSIQLRRQISKDSFSAETALVEGLILSREGKQKEANALYKKVEEELYRQLASSKELPPSTKSMTILRECLDNYCLSLEQSGDKKALEEKRRKLADLNEWLVILGENGTA